MRKILFMAVMMFVLQAAVRADAAPIIQVVPGGNGVYYVRAVGFAEVGGVEVEIQYDTATLANPRIAQGTMLASTMFIPNPKFSASSLKIAAMSLSALKGDGDLATITFDLKGENPATPAVVRSKLAAATGAVVKHETQTGGGGGGGGDNSGGDNRGGDNRGGGSNTGGGGDGGGSGYVGGGGITVAGAPSVGTITLPTDQIAAGAADRKTEYQPLVTDLRKDMTLPVGGAETAQAAGDQQAGQVKDEKKFVTYKSALQLFKDFKGEKSSKSLIALFAEVAIPGFAQEPPIAFADGKTPVRLTLVMKQKGSEAPKFILQGANVKQLSGEGEEVITWTIDALPKKDAVEAVLTVVDGQTILEIPLTIAPRIDPQLAKGKALSEADFALYLGKPAKFDLNKDGKFDAVDDYIYAANYIVAMKIKPEKLPKEEKKEPVKPAAKDDAKAKEPVKVKDDKGKAGEKPAVKP